jgi:hypothetical protein
VRRTTSEPTLTSFKGTRCDLPRVEEVALSAADFDLRLNAYMRQGILTDYLPTLFTEPGPPLGQNSGRAQILRVPRALKRARP